MNTGGGVEVAENVEIVHLGNVYVRCFLFYKIGVDYTSNKAHAQYAYPLPV